MDLRVGGKYVQPCVGPPAEQILTSASSWGRQVPHWKENRFGLVR